MGLPLLTEKIASKNSTTMTWAVYDGDVPTMLALRSRLEWRTGSSFQTGVENNCVVEKPVLLGMAWDPGNVQQWKHKVGFHNRGLP